MVVDKRDGRQQEFDQKKIVDAMVKAYEAERGEVDEEFKQFAEQVAESVEKLVKASWEVKDHKVLSVEDIQDVIENKLMASRYKDVAKKYILYRNKRTRSREYNADFMKEVTRKLEANDVENQNANMDEHSFGGRRGGTESVLMKKYALDYLVSDIARKKHLDNEIYIHDLDHFASGDHNCLSVPIDDLLANGFKTRQTDMRPAGSISTAMHLLAVIFQCQSLEQFGGVSATHLDWSMVPYVRKSFYKHFKDGCRYILNQEIDFEKDNEDFNVVEELISSPLYTDYDVSVYKYALDMTEKETRQAVEAMLHNLNSLQSRSGSQLPFSSVNYGTCALPEGRMVTRNILEVSMEGLGKFHRTSIFPCQIFQCMKGVNRKEGDPNYDLFKLALKCTALRLYPNYCNVDWSGNAGYDPNDPRTYMSTMG